MSKLNTKYLNAEAQSFRRGAEGTKNIVFLRVSAETLHLCVKIFKDA